MVEPSLTGQTDRIMELLRDFVRFEHCLEPVLPADLARFKQRLDEHNLGSRPGGVLRYGLVHRICIVLSYQKEHPTMGELGEALDVPLSTATRLVDWLVEEGYVERLPDPRDRRVVRVTLTKTGREFRQTIDEFIRQHVQEILTRFTASERDDLIRLLGKLMKVLEEVRR